MGIITEILAYYKQMAVLLLALLLGTSPTSADGEYDRWTASEASSIETAVTDFESLCLRRFQHSVEMKSKVEYDVAVFRTKEHCRCVSDFFLEEGDITYVQVVNLELKNRLKDLPVLPGELEIYLEDFDEKRMECLEAISAM